MEKKLSIIVPVYNAEKFIQKCVDSIVNQTYQNIELIISDDCSTDNTVELCQYWVEENQERFVRAQIITSDLNTGVSANGNRGRDACQGEWIKGIAGDDLLTPNCIADCVEYVQQHPNIIYLFGKIEAFGANEEKNKYFSEHVFDYSFFNLDIEGQLERLVFEQNCVPASTCFYNRQKAIELGIRNDERIPLLEDWPKWIMILGKRVKLEFMDKVLVLYRIHEKSLSTSSCLSGQRSHLFYSTCTIVTQFGKKEIKQMQQIGWQKDMLIYMKGLYVWKGNISRLLPLVLIASESLSLNHFLGCEMY